MSKTLKESQKEILRFVKEAEDCLNIECGYSSVLMLFSVILAVSEAMIGSVSKGKRTLEDELINNFVGYMDNKEWFINNTSTALQDDQFFELLYDLRNGLVHQLSMPQGIGLIRTSAETFALDKNNIKYFISVQGLISAVRDTIETIIKNPKFSDNEMDPNRASFSLTNPRGIGSRQVVRTLEGFESSGSAVKSIIDGNE
jgi:hypothetical protein